MIKPEIPAINPTEMIHVHPTTALELIPPEHDCLTPEAIEDRIAHVEAVDTFWALVATHPKVSERLCRILYFLAEGHNQAEIADYYNLKPKRIKTLVHRAYRLARKLTQTSMDPADQEALPLD